MRQKQDLQKQRQPLQDSPVRHFRKGFAVQNDIPSAPADPAIFRFCIFIHIFYIKRASRKTREAYGLYLEDYYSYSGFEAKSIDPRLAINLPSVGVWFSSRTTKY